MILEESEVIDGGLVRRIEDVPARWKCIYADPPWSYNDSNVPGGGSDRHYDNMSLRDICDLPVGDLAHPDGAHLWLWTTWPMIREGAHKEVIDAWGFEWKGEIVWKKVSKNWNTFFGVGRWLRPCTEVLIFAARKGSSSKKFPKLQAKGKELIGCQEQPVEGYFGCEDHPVEGHSRKPMRFRRIVEQLSEGPRIELFARQFCHGWSSWGNQL